MTSVGMHPSLALAAAATTTATIDRELHDKTKGPIDALDKRWRHDMGTCCDSADTLIHDDPQNRLNLYGLKREKHDNYSHRSWTRCTARSIVAQDKRHHHAMTFADTVQNDQPPASYVSPLDVLMSVASHHDNAKDHDCSIHDQPLHAIDHKRKKSSMIRRPSIASIGLAYLHAVASVPSVIDDHAFNRRDDDECRFLSTRAYVSQDVLHEAFQTLEKTLCRQWHRGLRMIPVGTFARGGLFLSVLDVLAVVPSSQSSCSSSSSSASSCNDDDDDVNMTALMRILRTFHDIKHGQYYMEHRRDQDAPDDDDDVSAPQRLVVPIQFDTTPLLLLDLKIFRAGAHASIAQLYFTGPERFVQRVLRAALGPWWQPLINTIYEKKEDDASRENTSVSRVFNVMKATFGDDAMRTLHHEQDVFHLFQVPYVAPRNRI